MQCPTCNKKLSCLDSRTRFDGRTRRKYICPSCQEKFATVEHFAEKVYGNNKLVATETENHKYELLKKRIFEVLGEI